MVVGYHHLRKPPYNNICICIQIYNYVYKLSSSQALRKRFVSHITGFRNYCRYQGFCEDAVFQYISTICSNHVSNNMLEKCKTGVRFSIFSSCKENWRHCAQILMLTLIEIEKRKLWLEYIIIYMLSIISPETFTNLHRPKIPQKRANFLESCKPQSSTNFWDCSDSAGFVHFVHQQNSWKP